MPRREVEEASLRPERRGLAARMTWLDEGRSRALSTRFACFIDLFCVLYFGLLNAS